MTPIKLFKLSLTILVAALAGCSEGNKNAKDIAVSENMSPDKEELASGAIKTRLYEAGEVNGDTINIRGKFILFFGPEESGETTTDSLSQKLKEFHDIRAAITKSLSTNEDIKVAYSTVGFFKIFSSSKGAMTITKSALSTKVGVLVSDGHQPAKIRKGIQPASDYQDFINTYFFLVNP